MEVLPSRLSNQEKPEQKSPGGFFRDVKRPDKKTKDAVWGAEWAWRTVGIGEIPPEQREVVLSDLRGIGPEKPLGFLTYDVIKACGEDPDAILAEAKEKGFFAKYIYQSNIQTNWRKCLYIADLDSLTKLIK